MTMQLLEALTILTAGNSGEINYHANDESFAIMQDARKTVCATATQLMDHRHLTSSSNFGPKPPLHTSGKATATWGNWQ